MKLTTTAQNPLEWIAVKTGVAPEPVAVAHFGYLVSKFVLEAIDKGVFEAIGKRKVTANDIATACKLNTTAVEKLLRLFASMGLVITSPPHFALTAKAKKWLLKDSPSSLYWLLLFDQKVCFEWMNYASTFLETGKGLQYHDSFTTEQWFYYQKAMEAVAKNAAREITRRVPSFSAPTQMLDIGGSHGLYAAAFCKKYASLKATILDLPAAVEQAQHMDRDPQVSARLSYTAGNILHDEIGSNKYDFILLASVAHHFTEEENKLVAQKVQAALKPGGYFTIMEVVSPGQIKKNEDMLGAIGDIFFALSSTSGTWSKDDIQQWMKEAGLNVVKKSTFLFLPGYTAITGKKLA
ncbi:methyltransferase [Aridibaculum aurantiacum]|uniref:methyltransferase n=1 Tax=Aridibaculum aurantiacum TaxID=2810307 RepID=UPI001A9792FB|nr:class I SAM-dependent methyltransferase [Aridibaculum aurantiacum]